MIGAGINLVMTVIGFSVSIMFIVFVCTRLICARIQLSASRRSFPRSSRSNLGILERGLRSLEPVTVANFPTKKYSDDLFLAAEDAQCTVCLSEYHSEDVLRILPYCGHSFHATCIDIWLQQHSTCPVCRISLRDLPDKKQMMPLFSSAIRSTYGIEPYHTCSYNCLLAASVLPSRTNDNHVMDLIQESHCESNSHEAEDGEQLPPVTDSNQNAKTRETSA